MKVKTTEEKLNMIKLLIDNRKRLCAELLAFSYTAEDEVFDVVATTTLEEIEEVIYADNDISIGR